MPPRCNPDKQPPRQQALLLQLRPKEPPEPVRLDPAHLAPSQRSPRREHRLSPALAVSVLLHSLPLLALIGWQPDTVEPPKAIPIELVLEQPPPVPALPEPPPPPQRMHRASADLAEATAPKVEPGVDSPRPAAAEPDRPSEPQAVATAPPAPPEPAPAGEKPAPAEDQAQPPESETKTAALTPPLPRRPAPHPRPETRTVLVVPRDSAWPLPLPRDRPPRQPPRFASLTGPSAVRDEYCVRALNLTLRHLDLLPRSYLRERRGRTVLTIRVLGDGTINSVKVAETSGFSDIDQRIERMVFAVGQYPPLPTRMPGPWMDFSFIMVFPDILER